MPMQISEKLPRVTRDVRHQPVTLVVALPMEPSTKRGAWAQVSAGPLAPYVLDAPCAQTHRSNVGKLVSCGLLYADNDTVAVGPDNTLQVGRKGVCTSKQQAPVKLVAASQQPLFSFHYLTPCATLGSGAARRLNAYPLHQQDNWALGSDLQSLAGFDCLQPEYLHLSPLSPSTPVASIHRVGHQAAILLLSFKRMSPTWLLAVCCCPAHTQVWYTAITAAGGRSGTVENMVVANAASVKGKLVIEAINILGVPGNKTDKPVVTVYGIKNRVQSAYDAGTGVLKITGLKLDAGAALNVDWWMRKA